jgi:hypothetical protein
MLNRSLWLNKRELHILVLALACIPVMAYADWMATLQSYATNVRLGLYALGGTIAVAGLVWSGITWIVARVSGDRSHGFMDYLKDTLVIVAVGGAIVLGTAAWQVFGSGAPA